MVTNADRDFVETIKVELVNKNIIFNKPTAQRLDSYFIINAKENSQATNSAIANENINLHYNVSSNINKSSVEAATGGVL